ncbi:hypothetical protein SESBI_15815 [Sesbania bispinosa]|nr:hypothetical protein SESBI_15815 [Sesbania bispinosa]
MRTKHFKQVLPPNPPPPPLVSCPQENEVLKKQSSLDLGKDIDLVNSGFNNDNNVGSSSMGLPPPHANLSDVHMVFPQENFGGFNNVSDLGVFPPSNFGDLIGESDLGSEVFSLSYFGGLIGESDSRLGAFPLENFGNLNDESDHLGSKVLPPQGNFEGVNGENDLWLLPQGNFGGLNGESDEGNYEGLNVGSDLGVLPQGNFGGLNGESDEGIYEGLNVGSDSGVLPQVNFGDLNGESDEGNCEGLDVGSDSGMLPQDNFGGLNGESDLGMLLEDNFEGLNGERGDSSHVWPEGNFGDLNDGSDRLKMYLEGNFEGLNGENNSGILNGISTDEIGGSNIWPSYGHFESSIGGSYKEIEQHNENQGWAINNTGLPPPHANLSDVDMVFPQENFGGFNNVSDLEVFPPSNFGDLIGLGAFPLENFGNLNNESDHLGSKVLLPQGNFEGVNGENDLWLLPQGNFGGLNGESDEGNYEALNVGSDSGVLPQGNFGGLNSQSDEGNYEGLNVGSDSGMLPQDNFGGFNGESDLGMLLEDNFEGLNGERGDSSQVWPEGNFGDLNDGSDPLKMYLEGNFEGLSGENNSGILNGSSTNEIGGRNIWPSYGHFESSIGGSYMEIEQHNENQGWAIDNTGLIRGYQNNSGANTIEVAMGRFDANIVGNYNGNNLNSGLPTHGNFVSCGEFGSDAQVPTFGGNVP